jgi:uncharacterized protein
MKNPFKYGGIVSGPYFADRKQELDELSREMANTNRIFLVSPRRFGKTCLLLNLVDQLEAQDLAAAYIDLNAHPDLRSLAGALAGATARALESNTDRLLKLFAGFRRLRPKVGVDAQGNVSAGVELAAGDQEALPALIEGMAHAEALAKKKKRKLVVVIDEFSDIEKYNGGTVEKAMRSEIQKHQHIGYIFSGSEPTVMLSMVRERNRAFFKMGRIMELGPLKRKTYMGFILGWFEKGGYKVDAVAVLRILDIGVDVPYNIQRLCHILWETAIESKKIDAALIERAPLLVARQDSPHYEMLWRTATQAQKNLLIALSVDPQAQPFSKTFQMRHGIGPSSSIKASLVSLVKKGIVSRTLEGHYQFVDHFMPYWITDLRL